VFYTGPPLRAGFNTFNLPQVQITRQNTIPRASGQDQLLKVEVPVQDRGPTMTDCIFRTSRLHDLSFAHFPATPPNKVHNLLHTLSITK
jgi:hypothetical protein